jgi:hypothetical protein
LASAVVNEIVTPTRHRELVALTAADASSTPSRQPTVGQTPHVVGTESD